MSKLLFGALVVVFFAGHTTGALADHPRDLNSLLKGKYRFTLNQTCTYSRAGFSTPPPGGDVLGIAQSGEDFIQGVFKFDGDGGVTLAERGIFQSQGISYPGYFPITTYTDICTGTYQINNDLSFTYEVACTTTFMTGFYAGGWEKVAGIKYEGQLDRSRDSFISTAVSDAVQTQNFSNGDTNQRVCGGQATAIKIP